MSMIKVEIGDDQIHEYASGITAGEVLENVYGKKSGAVAAIVDGLEKDMSFTLESNCKIDAILGDSKKVCTFLDTHVHIYLLRQS